MLVKTRYLATVPKARIDSHRPFLAYRRRKQKLRKVFTKDSNRLNISFFLSFFNYLVGNRRVQKALERIVHGHPHQLSQFRSGIAVLLAKVVIHLVAALLSVCVQTN